MQSKNAQTSSPGIKHVYGQVFTLGLTAMLVQIVMLREFMFVFGGNELIIGVILSNWMVLTGAGAFAGKKAINIKNTNRFSRSAMILLGWIPAILLFVIEFFRNQVFKPGIEVGFFQIMISAAVIITPFCLLSGFLFTYLSGIVSHYNQKIPAEKTYAIESAGSLTAGILASFLLFFLFSNFQIMILLPLCTCLLLIFPLHINETRPLNIIIVIINLILISLLFVMKADYHLKSVLFPNQEILLFRDTPYGNLAVTKSADQLNIFDNGKLLFSTDNQIANEEAVHYAMAQHPDPRDILLVSGGISGITDEITKYNVDHIDYVEINPFIFNIGKQYTRSLEDARIHLIRQDARMFIRKATKAYDVILINLPEPSTAQLNRYYTLEFMQQISRIMKDNCIVVLNMPSTANYISDEAISLNSVIYNTCKEIFRHVLIISGEKNYYLASDKPLKFNISQNIVNKNIKNDYLNQYYIDTLSLQERSDYLLKHLDSEAEINRDFKPVSYFYYLNYWLSQFNQGENLLWIIFSLLIILLVIATVLLKPVTSALMITGFSASSLEIVLLLSLQILSGYIYQVIGVCMAVFMGGLALGAVSRMLVFRNISTKQFVMLLTFEGILAVIIPAFLVIPIIQSGIVYALLAVLLLLFGIAFIAGVLFSMAVHLRRGGLTDNVAALYSADLIGSALGAFLTSVFLIPLLGVMTTSYLIGGLLLVYALNLIFRRKHSY
ncbi:MAG: hypothetical protein JXR41_14445 [Bacteroidales bacterium]|nr:hypothetical protein [Bacteroidales bacterium]